MAKLDCINLYQCEKGFRTGERVLACHYLLYVHKGSGRYKIGNTLYSGTVGDILYCPPGMGNTIYADETDPFLLSGIEFTLESCPEVEASTYQIPTKTNILTDNFLIAVINRMIGETSRPKIYNRQICDHLLSSLIFELIRISKIGGQSDENIPLKILDYIKDNLQREVTYEELAGVFSYHKSSINRIVSSTAGMSPREYQIDLRIKKAMELLSLSKKSLSEIAALCGYNSAMFFSRQFKAKTGHTPSEYRQMKQN